MSKPVDQDQAKNTPGSPPPRPKRNAASDSTPPSRPKRGKENPPPRPRRTRTSESTSSVLSGSKRKLILAVAGLLGVILLLAGIGSLTGPSSTTAADYTTAEVREIINILKYDDETRHGLLIPDSWAKHEQISIDLWEAVLGKPDVVAKPRRSGEMWTYRTKDGSVAVPVIMSKELGARDVGMLWLSAGEAELSVALGNKLVDREALKQCILAIKRRVDRNLPDDPYEGKTPDEIREQVAKEADERHRQERIEQDRKEAAWRAEMDRLAEKREAEASIRRKADSDFHDHVREYFRFGTPEREKLSEQSNDWIKRRIEILTKSHEAGEDWKKVSIPGKGFVEQALTNNVAVPVVGARSDQTAEIEQADGKDETPAVRGSKREDNRAYWKINTGGYFIRQTDGAWMDHWATGKSWGPYKQDDVTDEYVEISRTEGTAILRLYDDRIEVRFVSKGEDYEELYEGGWADPKTIKTEPETNTTPASESKSRAERIAELTEQALNKTVSLKSPYRRDRYPDAPTDKIAVQYAVGEIARQVGFQYDFQTSFKNTDPICRQWIKPTIRNQKFRNAIESILKPVGLTYRINKGVIVLEKQ